MELPGIGKQCSFPNCKQLDFLPFECICKRFFCREHYLKHVESCAQAKEVKITETSTVNEYFTCSEEGCSVKSIIPLRCDKCKQHFCVAHRHINECQKVDEKILQEAIEKCNLPKKQFENAKAVVDQQIESNISNAKRKGKNIETANKIQLMRLKSKAIGQKNIPTADRLYFSIFNDNFCPGGKPVFVSREWTIGRSIDAFADECKIPNNNNAARAQKLRLFKKSNRKIVSSNMSDNMNSLILNCVVINGEDLILDYVDS